MTDHVAVLFANDAFYTAFAARDTAALDAVWSRRDALSCIHPGWGPLAGRDAVMESWDGILTGRHPPEITCHNARAFVLGDVAYVICLERIGEPGTKRARAERRSDASALAQTDEANCVCRK